MRAPPSGARRWACWAGSSTKPPCRLLPALPRATTMPKCGAPPPAPLAWPLQYRRARSAPPSSPRCAVRPGGGGEKAAPRPGSSAPPDAAPALIAALDDGYWQVRLRAARALGQLGATAAIPALGTALQHEVSNLRKEAA